MFRTLLLGAGLIAAASTARADAISLVPPNDNYPQAAKAMAAYAEQADWAISVEQDDSGKSEAVEVILDIYGRLPKVKGVSLIKRWFTDIYPASLWSGLLWRSAP